MGAHHVACWLRTATHAMKMLPTRRLELRVAGAVRVVVTLRPAHRARQSTGVYVATPSTVPTSGWLRALHL
jgi:hypothetical protein